MRSALVFRSSLYDELDEDLLQVLLGYLLLALESCSWVGLAGGGGRGLCGAVGTLGRGRGLYVAASASVGAAGCAGRDTAERRRVRGLVLGLAGRSCLSWVALALLLAVLEEVVEAMLHGARWLVHGGHMGALPATVVVHFVFVDGGWIGGCWVHRREAGIVCASEGVT